MAELQQHAVTNKLSLAQLAMANEVAVSGKSEAEINASNSPRVSSSSLLTRLILNNPF
jgi:L-serine deaminase